MNSPTDTAWPVLALMDVTPDDVTATLGGSRPHLRFGAVQIKPAHTADVDLYGDLDRCDALLDAGKARVAELRSMLRESDAAASGPGERDS